MIVLAYKFKGGIYCPECAEALFGRDEEGSIANIDCDGNEAEIIDSRVIWEDENLFERQALTCGTCEKEVDSVTPQIAPRHFPTGDCSGQPMHHQCKECEAYLCPCEYGYGHDCEPKTMQSEPKATPLTYADLELPNDVHERFWRIQNEVERLSNKEITEWIMFLFTQPKVEG